MRIYVSEKENIDLSKKCYLTFSTKDEQAIDWNVSAQSLEQHEAEIRKQERQKVIAELEEWANTCYLVESIYEGVYCIDKDDLKQKLKEMKEVRDE